ncbi:hypothetical protein HEP81_04633 [Streptomyces griseofuscus]|uniref:Uncharacterized protein n=1 Tax=Streptomyces griseofuscus TaxID=146922 RepID=A0A7H1Q3M6_9ACTN|nr:hypothetical protein [Streptomyces griseofuscus]QNT94906.1 hypothetical protein HEP81_04633 [Streptomyces griseofuscus]
MDASSKVIPIEIAQQIANQIDQAHGTPMVEARIYGLLADAGYTAEEIGPMTRVHWARVLNRLALRKLSAGAQAMVDHGALSGDSGYHIAQLGPEGQAGMLARIRNGEFATDNDLQCAALDIQGDEEAAIPA